MSRVYIGLGSNVGDRLANILDGLDRLDAGKQVSVCRVSTIIETSPVGVRGHRRYLNAVAELETSLDPPALVACCLEVEQAMGRTRDPADDVPQPRTLDLDVLLMGDTVTDEPGVCIPHPRLQDRAFVLLPLVELDPDLAHPVLGSTVKDLLAAEIERFGPVQQRCAILKPGSLLSDESDSGPAGLSPN
ncbi:MAG: 2-amino-4-hydroxy-6-hydroxymethyldihydropteridine diphosphokinase [Phycisphaerales bacterium]|nr:2-amino-4-hydroxy-6-hydroxymethyldihydropteridine diphosphokinase [Phycisphaerales bacterium]